jgi:arylsulfatase A-like enzyme
MKGIIIQYGSTSRVRRLFSKITGLLLAALCCSLVLTAQKRPNIIYILTDQWRSSAFGYAGNKQVQTPNMDAFSRESVSFTNCVSVLAKCTPHRAALLTGRYPTTTGMFMNDLYLPSSELCMAEIFKSAGYATAYYGKWHLDGHGRFNNVAPARRQGFDYWKASECSHSYNHMLYYENDDPQVKYWPEYSPFAIERDAEHYLEDMVGKDKPFLLFLAIATPHFAKDQAPESYRAMYPEDQLQLRPNVDDRKFPNLRTELQYYYAHCTATDKALGDLFKKIKSLGLFDNTIIVFSSDHGEMMGSHGVRPHEKQLAWDEAVKVPFLIRYPGIGNNAGKSTLVPFNTTDILPTLLSMTGIKIPATIQGESIEKFVKHPDKSSKRATLYMSVYAVAPTKFAEYRAVKTSKYTYVRTIQGPDKLFDNLADPYQMNNLIGKTDFRRVQQNMDKLLQKQLKAIGDDFKPYQYYLDKFGFSDFNKKTGEVPYELQTGTNVRVFTPKQQ